MVNSAAFDITPYAMPSVPSTNCATKPIAGSSTNSVLIRFPLSPHFRDAVVNEALAPPARSCGSLCHAASDRSSRRGSACDWALIVGRRGHNRITFA